MTSWIGKSIAHDRVPAPIGLVGACYFTADTPDTNPLDQAH
jgi:hypothetical protein